MREAKMDYKLRTGKECKKVKCKRYEACVKWDAFAGGDSLRICRNCKNAFVSQYEAQPKHSGGE